MTFFESHIDGELAPLGGGSLSPRRFRRMVQHARNCHRCATLYERSIRVLRQLENQSPFEPAQIELDALSAFNAPPAFGSARPASTWGAPWLLTTLAFAAAVTLFFVTRGPAEEEFSARGGTVSPVALRVFCGGNGAALAELKEGASCSVGQSLAFAVGAQPSHGQVFIALRGSALPPATASSAVTTGRPGAEEPVELTARLEREGEVEVVAAFAVDAASAQTAARGEPTTGALVLKRTVKVTP